MSTDDFLARFGASGTSRPDPVAAAQQAMRTSLPARFYKEGGVLTRDGLFHVALDGRTALTPARRPLAVATRAVAEALAAEWQAQGERIDPARMPLTRLVNSAIDGVADQEEAVRAEIVRYAGSDALCYRAGEPEALVARQNQIWQPILNGIEALVGARFLLAEGVVFAQQPEGTLAAIARQVAAIPAPLALAGVHAVMTLTGSAILALALAKGQIDADAAWDAAHLDEDYQTGIWGSDEEAAERRALRRREFDAAVLLLAKG
ncbi:ATP12 family chaperone protein [Bosea sp. (in: a-proteobacteria)]|uniref:ATP12 family chaperone protein n=1 Tax=Bosea sp. (in: a-proteobacteria) TaxID=1871050 RepID=UPI00260288A4|nr:ATP12 family protein [Bosea sp. (in: a-proteobacteria)]MCO5092208.1 ATPase [Bosea sp. (in: a-proteobacteria)]